MVKTFLFQAIQFSQTLLFQLIPFCISIVFVYTQLNVKIVLFQTTQFSVSTVSMSKQFYFKQFSLAWVHSLNIKTVLFQVIQFSISTHFSAIWLIDGTLIRCQLSGPEWTWVHYWNLTIRLFRVIFRTLVVGGVLPLCRDAIGVFYSPAYLATFTMDYYYYKTLLEFDSNPWNHIIVSQQMINIKELLVLDNNTWNHLTVCQQIINIE